MIQPAAIEARGLGKTFGLSPILRTVNLTVANGGSAMVAGRNGSGKSTLLRILAGLSAVSSGQVLLFGKPARSLDPDDRRRVGLLSHQSFLYSNLTARENLEFYANLYGLKRPLADISGWLERVGLARAADERVRIFSRGMEQRLAIARAMMTLPDLLLMDEPFAALDTQGIRLVAGLIEEASSRGCALVITAHEARRLGGIRFAHYELAGGRLRPDLLADLNAQVISEPAAAAL